MGNLSVPRDDDKNLGKNLYLGSTHKIVWGLCFDPVNAFPGNLNNLNLNIFLSMVELQI